MVRGLLSGLRARLVLLILIVVVPLLLLIVYSGIEHRRYLGEEVKAEALRMTNMINAYHAQWITRSEQIVQALASVPTVKDYQSAECTATFRKLLQRYPSYTDFIAAKPNGEIFCSSSALEGDTSQSGSLSVAHHGWFQQSIATQSFVVSDVHIGEASGKYALFFGAPVYDDTGTIIAVVGAGLDMSILTDFAAQAGLPDGSIVTILDEAGFILARYPESQDVIGLQLSHDPLVEYIQQQQGQGAIELAGVDGTVRLYAFAQVQAETNQRHMYITVGIPQQVAFAQVQALMLRMLGWAALVGVLAIIVALIFGHYSILNPVQQVADGTQQLSAGNLGTQVTLQGGAREFHQLATSFNHMSEALFHHEKTLLEAETRYRKLVEDIPSITYMLRLSDQVLRYVSPRIAPLVGQSAEVLTSTPDVWMTTIYAGDHEKLQTALAYSHTTNAPLLLEHRMQRQDGAVVWVRNEGVVVYDDQTKEQLLLGTLSDITEQKQAEEVIQEQAEMMQELSTPLLHIGDTTVLMPVVGALDSRRAQQMMEILLKGVEHYGIKMVILDITGVAVVDSQVANAIIQTEHAVRLLGARVILTGIRPEVAQAMVGLGLDLGDIMTHSTLQTGITAVIKAEMRNRQHRI